MFICFLKISILKKLGTDFYFVWGIRLLSAYILFRLVKRTVVFKLYVFSVCVRLDA